MPKKKYFVKQLNFIIMETKRELTNDEKALLIGLMPETLKFATGLVLNGIEYDEVICYIYELSGLEKIIRSQLLKRLSHYHLKNEAALAAELLQNSNTGAEEMHNRALTYLQKLSAPDTPQYFEMSHSLELKSNTVVTDPTMLKIQQQIEKFLAEQMGNQRSAQPRISRFLLHKQLNKFIELLQPYIALARQMQIEKPGISDLHNIIRLANQTKKGGMLFDERRLSQMQRIKSGITIIELGGEITPEEMQLALRTSYSDDPEIFEEQVSLVQKSYDTVKDASKAREIKMIVYQYIKDTLNLWEHPSGTLLEFPFYGTTISQETFNFMHELEGRIKSGGMHQMFFPHIQRLYDQINFGEQGKLNPSEQRIVTLYKMFNPQNETPSPR
jgi:hypothetical protein